MTKRNRTEDVVGPEEDDADAKEDVPEIVLLRRKNMARNAAIIAALNIGQSKPPNPPTPVKRARPSPSQDGDRGSMPLRRSGRLKGTAAIEGDGRLYALPGTWVAALKYGSNRRKGGQPIQEYYGPKLSETEAAERKKVLQDQIDARDDLTMGSASYRHCLHRVQTMSDGVLAARVKAIERARGKLAKEKMLVFSHVLRARGKDELCALAEAALDRLVRGVPMPESDGTPFQSAAASQGSATDDMSANSTEDVKPVVNGSARVPTETVTP